MKLKALFERIIPRMYVIADSTDNSMTVSKRLYKHMCRLIGNEAKIFVFRVGDTFGFTVNPEQLKGVDTQMSELQYNDKYHTIGFETLCPSVNYMINEFGLPPVRRIRLSVKTKKTKQGMLYYKIKRPHAKRFREYKKA